MWKYIIKYETAIVVLYTLLPNIRSGISEAFFKQKSVEFRKQYQKYQVIFD